MTKDALNCTTAGCIHIPTGRWIVCLVLLLSTAAILVRRGWKGYWRAYFARRGWGWLSVMCLLPLISTLVFLRPFPVYTVVLAPVVYGVPLLAGFAIASEVVIRRRELFVAAVMLVLILAPNRSYLTAWQQEVNQPLRHVLAFFADLPDDGQPLTLIGRRVIVVCPYLSTMGRACEEKMMDDAEGYQPFENYSALPGHYLVYSPELQGWLEWDPTLAAIVSGQDPRWQRVFEIREWQIFQLTE